MARPRRVNKYRRAAEQPPRDVERLAYGGARRERWRGADWFVRDIPAHRAEKSYRCPACGTDVLPGQAHVVAWSAEHLFGDEAAVRDRRHYHAHCWRLA
ncbi:ATP/GTP-binding protein [Leucobacter triazinivorans]|uniref:ATP/GTP-binding protein n=1 Tax=Leucobacter triazinivorans TaxID=1784719 RepID=A0A4P6KC53_9MICO|nr:ATP/GTP-binding protein [Leucobacter triazinivorans]QBE47732.1 ATP/GTP-binding protein [Leucobacter triazinivorans]